VFYARSVRPGARDGKQTEIIAGLLPGEVVATTGSASLRSELLKSNLGEGCACGK
jgi:cobalt-zinc-cadmium efflux system membrane fusion protein